MNTLNETTLNAVAEHVAYPNEPCQMNAPAGNAESTGSGLSSIAVPFDRFRGASRNGSAERRRDHGLINPTCVSRWRDKSIIIFHG